MSALSNRIHVLHVDDEVADIDPAENPLEGEHERVTVKTVATIADGLDYLETADVDCVVAAYVLPDGTGLELMEQVREASPDLPFVVFTRESIEEIATDLIRSGVTDYVPKEPIPAQYTTLARRVEAAVTAPEAEQEGRDEERSSEEIGHRYRAIFEDPNVFLSLLDVDGSVLEINRTAMDSLDSAADAVVGQPIWEASWWDAETRNQIRRQIERASSGEYVGYEAELRTRDGEPSSIEGMIHPVTDESGTVTSLLVTARSITKQKERAQHLDDRNVQLTEEIARQKAAEERYRSLFDDNRIVIWEHDFSEAKAYLDELAAEVDDIETYLHEHPEELGQLMERVETLDVNENAVEYYGAESKDEVLENLDQLMAEEAWDLTIDLWADVARGATWFRGETVALTLDGERRDQILELHVPAANTDDFARVYLTGTDITEQKRLESRLEEYRLAVEHAAIPIAAVNEDYEYVFANGAYTDIHAPNREDLAGASVRDIFEGQTYETVEANLEAALDGDVVEYERTWVHPTEGQLTYEVNYYPVKNPNHEIRGAVALLYDVTTRKTREEELEKLASQLELQRNNLEVLNQMMRHDIRNDLQLVLAWAETLESEGHVDEAGHRHVETILEAAHNAVNLTDTARELADVMLRIGAGQQPIRVAPTIENEIDRVRSSNTNASVIVEGRLPSVTVQADEMLGSAFRNILNNAIQHNDKTVPEVTVSATVHDETVEIRFADNGPGILDEQKETIFGKDEKGLESKGTGLGLYLVYTLISQYGGRVWVEDNEPEGSVFVIELPIA